LVIARALGPPHQSFDLLAPFVAPGGARALFVGRSAELPQEAEVWKEGIAIIRHGGPER
jgi:hypothetical protein